MRTISYKEAPIAMHIRMKHCCVHHSFNALYTTRQVETQFYFNHQQDYIIIVVAIERQKGNYALIIL